MERPRSTPLLKQIPIVCAEFVVGRFAALAGIVGGGECGNEVEKFLEYFFSGFEDGEEVVFEMVEEGGVVIADFFDDETEYFEGVLRI